MFRVVFIAALTAAAALVTVALPAHLAQAKGDFDGTWQIDVAAAGKMDRSGAYQCPPLHVTLEVLDGKFTGYLERAYRGKVLNAYDQGATAVTGAVDNSGAVNLNWETIAATGLATKNHIAVAWQGICGPRTAVGAIY